MAGTRVQAAPGYHLVQAAAAAADTPGPGNRGSNGSAAQELGPCPEVPRGRDAVVMSASDPHLSSAAPRMARSEATPATPVRGPIDWRALRFADRACCCEARPAVVVIMPPVAGRLHPTELLLCGHHYRASQMALAMSGATIFTVAGAALSSGDLWTVGAGSDREA